MMYFETVTETIGSSARLIFSVFTNSGPKSKFCSQQLHMNWSVVQSYNKIKFHDLLNSSTSIKSIFITTTHCTTVEWQVYLLDPTV